PRRRAARPDLPPAARLSAQIRPGAARRRGRLRPHPHGRSTFLPVRLTLRARPIPFRAVTRGASWRSLSAGRDAAMIPGRLVALVLLALALPAAAQIPAGSLGPLVPLLPFGPQPGGWVGDAVGDGYQIAKPEGAGPAWVALPEGQGEPGRRTIAVSVEAAPGATGGAGLLYALDRSGSYYAFVREGPQSIALYFHGPGGRQRNIAVTSSGFAVDRPMRLGIVEDGRAF